MSVKEHSAQDHCQGNPLYETLNDFVLKASLQEIENQKHEHEHIEDEKTNTIAINNTGI